MFSKACEYAIRSALFIAEQSRQRKRVSLKEIAYKIASPEAYTSKILQQLVKNEIVFSVQGASGGFEMSEKLMLDTALIKIVNAIDGDNVYNACGLGLSECSALKPCPLHYKFSKIREELKTMLESTSIYELSVDMKEGLTYLKL